MNLIIDTIWITFKLCTTIAAEAEATPSLA